MEIVCEVFGVIAHCSLLFFLGVFPLTRWIGVPLLFFYATLFAMLILLC